MSTFCSWDFDLAAVMLFSNDDLSIAEAVELEAATVKKHTRYVKHVNGWRLIAAEQILAHGVDITDRVRRVGLNL